MPKTMTARYSGRCRTCRGGITPGQEIVYEGKGRSHHAECPPVVITFASGDTITRNRRGTCEDAPCCGCCTF